MLWVLGKCMYFFRNSKSTFCVDSTIKFYVTGLGSNLAMNALNHFKIGYLFFLWSVHNIYVCIHTHNRNYLMTTYDAVTCYKNIIIIIVKKLPTDTIWVELYIIQNNGDIAEKCTSQSCGVMWDQIYSRRECVVAVLVSIPISCIMLNSPLAKDMPGHALNCISFPKCPKCFAKEIELQRRHDQIIWQKLKRLGS